MILLMKFKWKHSVLPKYTKIHKIKSMKNLMEFSCITIWNVRELNHIKFAENKNKVKKLSQEVETSD